MIKPAAGTTDRGRDRATTVVLALLCVQVPCHTDPVLLATVLVRASNTAARPMTVELCPVPELSRAVWRGTRMLTWALALSDAPLRSHPRSPRPGNTSTPDPDELMAATQAAALAAVVGLYGPGVEAVLQIARAPEQVGACHRALSSTPAPSGPDHRGRVSRADPSPAPRSTTPKRPPAWAW